MKLEKYISDLLYRYQCVTIPGLGALVTENQSAQISGSACTFIPPKKLIFFNANIKNNDGLLANHISLSEKISYDQALEKLNLEVKKWIGMLEKKDRLVLEQIGELFLNSEGRFVFEPYNSVNYLTSSFGFNSFVIPEVKRQEISKTEVTEQQPVIVLEAENINIEKELVIVNQKKKFDFTYLKYAGAVALFLGVSATIYKLQHEQQVKIDTLLVKKEVQKEVQNSIQQATFFIDVPITPVSLTVKEEKENYHLIAGAFRSDENATKALKMLQQQGYEAKILKPNPSGLIPVAYGSYKTEEEAENVKQRMWKEEKLDTWILIE